MIRKGFGALTSPSASTTQDGTRNTRKAREESGVATWESFCGTELLPGKKPGSCFSRDRSSPLVAAYSSIGGVRFARNEVRCTRWTVVATNDHFIKRLQRLPYSQSCRNAPRDAGFVACRELGLTPCWVVDVATSDVHRMYTSNVKQDVRPTSYGVTSCYIHHPPTATKTEWKALLACIFSAGFVSERSILFAFDYQFVNHSQ